MGTMKWIGEDREREKQEGEGLDPVLQEFYKNSTVHVNKEILCPRV